MKEHTAAIRLVRVGRFRHCDKQEKESLIKNNLWKSKNTWNCTNIYAEYRRHGIKVRTYIEVQVIEVEL